MEFSFERRARSRKAKAGLRSLFGKAPSAAEAKDRLDRLAARALKGAEVTVSAKRITAELHSFVPALRILIEPDGALVVRGQAGAGPGYADDAIARMAPILDELDYAWEPDDFDPRAAALAWLTEQLRGGATELGMPDDRAFRVDAPILTALGPRDAAWRDAVLADPSAGRDIFAWWDRKPGHLERSRAVLAMWHEVPWREPVDKPERALMKRVDADLRAARKADPELALPYAEWADIAGYLGDDERAEQLRERATGPSKIGYRRYDMDVEIGGGWTITLPGRFVSSWEDDGERYWATDGPRMVEVTKLETTEQDSAKLIEIAPPNHPVIAATAEGTRHARIEAHDEDHLHIVHGLVAVAPHVAIFTCKATAADEPWALDTWRSLRHA
ncbi:MAG TPA: hypothetical protein VH165_37660 [Kofleriaceae bacterium]|nr:hypothetical protein [Kofleriaceae bacterium]